MSLNTLGGRGLLSLALIIPAALALSFCEAKADPIANLAIYAADRMICGLQVDQNWVNKEMVSALMADQGKQVGEVMADITETGLVLQQRLKETGKVVEYCSKRAGR